MLVDGVIRKKRGGALQDYSAGVFWTAFTKLSSALLSGSLLQPIGTVLKREFQKKGVPVGQWCGWIVDDVWWRLQR